MDAGSYLKYEPQYTGNGSVTFYSLVKILNSLKEDDPIQYFKQKMKYCMYNLEQYTLLNEFFEQKKKEINMCKIDEIFKLEMINSINILQMITNVIIGYQEQLDLQFRLKAFKHAYDSIDLLVNDLERLNYNYERFSRKIPYPNLRIRKMKTRWGVCNIISHNITLNLELMKRDISYLDYVIIHEMSHLIYGDHSARFWALVGENMPDYKKYRDEMKEF